MDWPPHRIVSVVLIVVVGIALYHNFKRQDEALASAGGRVPMSPLMKVHTYVVPEDLFGVPVRHCSRSDMYATEILVPELMRQHEPVQVTDLALASYYLIPHRSTCLYHNCVFNQHRPPDQCKQAAASAMMAIVSYIRERWPFWNETLGNNHVVVFAWDQAAEVLGWIDQPVRQLLQPAIHVTTLGVMSAHPNFNLHKDIVIPPYLNFSYWERMRTTHLKSIDMPRPVKAYFRGTILADQKYSHGVRQILKQMSALHSDLMIKEGAVDWYPSELSLAEFALCPLGWSPWSPRLFEALAMGAVPIIISDGIVVPYENQFNYRAFTLKTSQGNVTNIMDVLRDVPSSVVAQKRRAGKDVWRKLFFHLPPQVNDAFYNLLVELTRKKRKHAPIGQANYT